MTGPSTGAQRPLGDAVAAVGLLVRRRLAQPVPEVRGQLRAGGGTLDQPFLELVDQPFQTGQLLRPRVLPQQLIDQLIWDRRPDRRKRSTE
jgi:hypothetical protein